MKKCKIFILVFLVLLNLLFINCVFSQSVRPTDTIEVALNKTTYLHLNGPTKPYTVHVGGLAGQIIYDSVAASNGVVWVRAGKENVAESNMIIAAQDTVLLFVLRYVKEPKNTLWMYNIYPVGSKPKNIAAVAPTAAVESIQDVKFDNMSVYKLKRYMNTSNSVGGVTLNLENIATDSTNIFYKFTIENKSKIDFEIDAEFMMLKTKSKNNRRSAIGAETNLNAIADSGNEKIIPNKKTRTFIYKTAVTPIRGDEIIVFTIIEKSPITKGRQLTIKVNPYLFSKIQKL